MSIVYIDSDGRKRFGIEQSCLFCGIKFLTREDQPGTYCSKDCSYKARKKTKTFKCASCDKVFGRAVSRSKNSKSGLYFCSRTCKDKSQRLGGIKEIMPSHYGISKIRNSEFYRKFYKEQYCVNRLCCSRCGYDEFECGIDIHHKDKNNMNNVKENLDALCSPCHRALHFGFWEYNLGL